jgi:hypothetical protein
MIATQIDPLAVTSSFNDTPVHLEAALVTVDGEVFHSVSTEMVVLRLQKASDVDALLRLGDNALKESHGVGAELLVCDARALGVGAADPAVTALLLHLVRDGSVPRVALLLADQAFSPVTPEVHAAIAEGDVAWAAEASFEALALWYATHSEAMRSWLAERSPDFVGGYGGSTYSVAALQCTVLRTSGYATAADFDKAFVTTMLKNHKALQGDTLIFDTSASAPVMGLKKYRFIFEHILMPLLSTGTPRTIVHVRSKGDVLLQLNAPRIEPLLESFNVELLEAETLDEAITLLHTQNAQPA